MKKVCPIVLSMLALLAINISSTAKAAPNCPPQYLNICKQLIKALEDNNDGHHDYTWDGTHLIIGANFASYDSINHSSSDIGSGNVQAGPREYIWHRDYFPKLLNEVIATSQGGQRVYLHMWDAWGSGGVHDWATVGLSNTPLAPPTPMATPQLTPNPVPQPTPAPQAVPSAIPNKVPHPMAQKIANGKAATNKPRSVSVTHNITNQSGQPIDKLNVNRHFATGSAGSLIEQEERAYLFDSNNDVWSCKVSGLGARQMPSANGATQIAGHVETLQFRSIHLAHIPGNHPMHSGCLISVEQ